MSYKESMEDQGYKESTWAPKHGGIAEALGIAHRGKGECVPLRAVSPGKACGKIISLHRLSNRYPSRTEPWQACQSPQWLSKTTAHLKWKRTIQGWA